MGELVVFINRPREQLGRLAHGSGIDPVFRGITCDKLMKAKAWNSGVQSQCLGNRIEGKEEQCFVGIRA